MSNFISYPRKLHTYAAHLWERLQELSNMFELFSVVYKKIFDSIMSLPMCCNI